jgi:hypothetical protein
MARGKATFRYGRRMRLHRHDAIGFAPGAHIQPGDEDLSPALAKLIQMERGIRREEWPRWPSRKDIHYTLKELLKLKDRDLYAAKLDDFTKMQIITAALIHWRNTESGELPDGFYDIQNPGIYSPERLRVLIQYAIDHLIQRYKPPSLEGANIEFVRKLAAYWQHTYGKRPTYWCNRDYNKRSKFVEFVNDCFIRLRHGKYDHIYQELTIYEFVKVALKGK